MKLHWASCCERVNNTFISPRFRTRHKGTGTANCWLNFKYNSTFRFRPLTRKTAVPISTCPVKRILEKSGGSFKFCDLIGSWIIYGYCFSCLGYTVQNMIWRTWMVRWRERNQQDATNLMFIIRLLSEHVSGIIIPIIRRTRVYTAAYSVLHWLWWLWLCGAGTQAVCTVPAPHNHSHHNQCSAHSCSPDDGHNDARNILDKSLIINIRLVASCWFLFTLVHDARSQEPKIWMVSV